MALKKKKKQPIIKKSANVLGATSATLDVANATLQPGVRLFVLRVASCLLLISAPRPGVLLKEVGQAEYWCGEARGENQH